MSRYRMVGVAGTPRGGGGRRYARGDDVERVSV